MARFQALSHDFYESMARLAQVWRTESVGWQDAKAEQFSMRVMTPVSGQCGKIHESLAQMDSILSRMAAEGLIDEK